MNKMFHQQSFTFVLTFFVARYFLLDISTTALSFKSFFVDPLSLIKENELSYISSADICFRIACSKNNDIWGVDDTKKSRNNYFRPSGVLVYDTSMRDGAQGESVSLSCDDKLKIANRLSQFGVDYIEAGWPSSNPKDTQFFIRAKNELDLCTRNKLVAFGSTRRKNINIHEDSQIHALIESGAPSVCIVTKAHLQQVKDVIRARPEENLRMIYESVHYLASYGKSVFVDMEHLFDGYKYDKEYAMECCRVAVESGACGLMLCDTNGGSMPWEIERITSSFVNEFNVTVGIHAHNDCGMAVANSIIAVKSGARIIQGTINGIGERTGNADLCSIVPSLALHVRSKMNCINSLQDITRLSRFIDETLNRKPNKAAPFVGSSAFAHKGGLHVAAIMRNPMTYQHIDPSKVGNQKRILVSELSGRQNILVKIRKHCIQNVSEDVLLEHANSILQRVKHLESIGYTFEKAEASLDIMILQAINGYYPTFCILDYSVHTVDSNLHPFSKFVDWYKGCEDYFCLQNILNGKKCSPSVKATVQIRTRISKEKNSNNGNNTVPQTGPSYIDCQVGSDGNGPVDALTSALLKALLPYHPSLVNIELVDYTYFILGSEEYNDRKTRVMIQFHDRVHDKTWSIVSVDRNIIHAILNALIDGLEYSLIKF